MANFKLGFIGAGFIAKFQAKAVTQIRGVDLAGVCALKGAEELADCANKAGIGPCAVYPSVAELWPQDYFVLKVDRADETISEYHRKQQTAHRRLERLNPL